MNKTFYCLLLAIGLIVVATLSRLLPHPANFTAIGAISLFAGTYLPRRWGILVPLVGMALTDAVIGWYDWPVLAGVYGSFVVVGFFGWYIRKQKTPATVGMGALAASVIFFAVTNFAVWAATPLYEKTGEGLFLAYALAVPFFRNMLAGDIVYTAVLFGVYELAKSFLGRARLARRPAAV